MKAASVLLVAILAPSVAADVTIVSFSPSDEPVNTDTAGLWNVQVEVDCRDILEVGDPLAPGATLLTRLSTKDGLEIEGPSHVPLEPCGTDGTQLVSLDYWVKATDLAAAERDADARFKATLMSGSSRSTLGADLTDVAHGSYDVAFRPGLSVQVLDVTHGRDHIQWTIEVTSHANSASQITTRATADGFTDTPLPFFLAPALSGTPPQARVVEQLTLVGPSWGKNRVTLHLDQSSMYTAGGATYTVDLVEQRGPTDGGVGPIGLPAALALVAIGAATYRRIRA